MTVKHKDRVAKLEIDVALSLCENIGTPRALSVWLMLRHGEIDQYLDLQIDPANYLGRPKAFRDDYLVTSILQKNQRLPTSYDRKGRAIERFRKAEAACKEANERLDGYMYRGILPDPDIVATIERAVVHIRDILGPLSRTKLSFAERHMRFGPGATTSLSGVVTQGKKYSHRTLDATTRVADYYLFSAPESWKRYCTGISLTESSKLTTVPKNSKIDRCICIEPDLNIFVQLGIGALLRERLRVHGCDLNDQSRNQHWASVAREFDLCTMDLSSASDTICREAVWLLLPHDWCDLLHFARVDSTRLGDEVIKLEKWSSMGNGYTFELESLLFYGILLGAADVGDERGAILSVFGDDLIMPNSIRELVERTLKYLGFSVNAEKTFGKGSFHESCGTDWFEGVNVRPFFLRSEHHDFPTVCYIIGNAIIRWSSYEGWRDVRLLPAWLRCFTACEARARHRIPFGFGDVGFFSSWDEARPRSTNSSRGWAGYDFSYRGIEPMKLVVSEQGCLTAYLNGNSSQFSLAREPLRGRFKPPTTRRGYVLTWPHMGPWI
jgi:hypothetical protein